ncbi:DNA methyltransferase [Hallella faecis]|uniref:site-specific DNA-methyltransferase n=1 Tax=Hallella faecis TaxID=2841596 RepID=UPI003F8AAC16
MIKDIMAHNADAAAGQKEMEVLRRYFPQCFDADGKFDIETFKASLPDGTTLTDETTGFNWLGKNYARMLTNMDTTTLIRPDEEHNAKPENRNSKNVYISGDNLDALQHLVKSYSGKVKVIYIDPPYNMGSDGFVYNDKFNFTAEDLAKRLEVSSERAERILSMTRRGSASHAAWLTFMLPRLSFARDLLTDDGVIFISIDDNEQANLKKLCDEVFGEENFVAQFIWEKRLNRENRREASVRHDYILCYSKNYYDDDVKRINQLPMSGKALASYSNPDNDPRGLWKSDPAHAQAGHGVESQFYTLVAPNGKKHEVPSGRCWIYNEETMVQAIKDNRIWFGQDGNGVPRIKTYLNAKERGLTPETMIFAKDGSTNEKAKNDLKELFDGIAVFETPKPVELIRHLLKMALKEGIAVDFFGGSSTTAQAIMEMSVDGSNLHYILVQLPEECKPGSEAAKAGYKTIDEIGMERIKRAAKKIHDANPLFAGDLGFKHYTLEEPKEDALLLMERFDPVSNNITPLNVDDFGLQTVLRTWLVADGYGLIEDAEEVMLGNYKAYWKGDHLYLINPDRNFDANSIAALMDKYHGEPFSPHNIVVFGYSFAFTHREELQKNLRTLKEGNKTLTVNIDVRY